MKYTSVLCFLISCLLCKPAFAGSMQANLAKPIYTAKESNKTILPARFGIKNNGTLISHSNLYAWLDACKKQRSPVHFPAGKYLLPADVEYDFGNNDLLITGDGPGKTILTTHAGPETNVAIPEKINLTESRMKKDGIYQVDITAATVHRDYVSVANAPPDSYIRIENGKVSVVTLETVKALGYITELDTEKPDPGIDGIYVVAKHGYHEYGGGFAHLTLGFSGSPLYLQGTVLQRKNGNWSRFSPGVAFTAAGNFSVRNISFSNFRPYLFLPASNKRNAILKTSDHFVVENCRFEHTARILATMTYAGISETPEWYKASSHYPATGPFRFKRFIIKGNEFRYIHESISWGTPPANFYSITGNNVHDCYTMLNCFYLFPPFNTAKRSYEKSRFSISGNSFTRIRSLNAGSENTIQLIRTWQEGNISSNVFTDCTGIHLYLSGRTIIRRNRIKTFMADAPPNQPRPPLILVKMALNELITLSNNNFHFGMMGNLVANESLASFQIQNNILYGAGNRYLVSDTRKMSRLDMYKSYIIANMAFFKTLAGNENIDTTVKVSDMIYFNKRRTRWEKQQNTYPMYLFSEVNHLTGNKQEIRFTGNEIETGYLTRIQKTIPAVYHSVTFSNNRIAFCTGFNAGNKHTTINNYRFTGNRVNNGSLVMTSLGNVSSSVRKVQISNNRFTYNIPVHFAFAASDSLLFQSNIFSYATSELHNAFIQSNAQIRLPETGSNNLLELSGHPGQVMSIYKNRFTAFMSKGTTLHVINPVSLFIQENEFDMNMLSWQSKTGKTRNAILITSDSSCSSINITGNNFLPESSKENYLVRFDDSAGMVPEITLKGNTVKGNNQFVVKTIEAGNKSFIKYYRGVIPDTCKENIHQVGETISIK